MLWWISLAGPSTFHLWHLLECGKHSQKESLVKCSRGITLHAFHVIWWRRQFLAHPLTTTLAWMGYLPFSASMLGCRDVSSLLHQCCGGYPLQVRRRSIYDTYLSAASIVKKSLWWSAAEESHYIYIYILYTIIYISICTNVYTCIELLFVCALARAVCNCKWTCNSWQSLWRVRPDCVRQVEWWASSGDIC